MGKIGQYDEFDHCFETGDRDTLQMVWEAYEKIVTLSEQLKEKGDDWPLEVADEFITSVMRVCGVIE